MRWWGSYGERTGLSGKVSKGLREGVLMGGARKLRIKDDHALEATPAHECCAATQKVE